MRIDIRALLPLAAALMFASQAAHAQMSLDQISSLSADSVPAEAEVTPVRAAMLREAALSLGSKAGLADRCAVLVADLEKRAYVLDRQYRFSAYVTKSGLLPPVITEARDAVQSTDEQVRVADRIYKIVVKARPVTTPPSWRDYLFVGLRLTKDLPMPVASALPKTAAEKAFWKKAVAEGWAHGQKLADEILERNLARLDRDFIGIMRYSYLLNNGMVSEPTVAVAPRVVSGDRNELRLGDTLMRVTDTGGFITDPMKWQPTVLPGSKAAQ